MPATRPPEHCRPGRYRRRQPHSRPSPSIRSARSAAAGHAARRDKQPGRREQFANPPPERAVARSGPMGFDGALDGGLVAHARAGAAGGDRFGLVDRPFQHVLVETLREGRRPRGGVAGHGELGLDLLPAIRVLPGFLVLRLSRLLRRRDAHDRGRPRPALRRFPTSLDVPPLDARLAAPCRPGSLPLARDLVMHPDWHHPPSSKLCGGVRSFGWPQVRLLAGRSAST
jgi:hypothetical protein